MPFLLWDPSEAITVILLLGVGVVLKMIVLGLGGAAAVMIYSSKIKRRGKRGQGVHMLWRQGLPVDPVFKKTALPSHLDMYR